MTSTRAQKLLAEATPLPWAPSRLFSNSTIPYEDAHLAAYAVNHLPDYEAAVEAFWILLGEIDADLNGELGDIRLAADNGRAALARLREVD